MSENQAEIIKQMHDHVVIKALQDPAFRTALVANPRATVEKEFNITLPADFKLNVIESPANTLSVVLPRVSAVAADGELSDSDLEAVAGGSAKMTPGFPTGFPGGRTSGGPLLTSNIGAAVGFIAPPPGTARCGVAY